MSWLWVSTVGGEGLGVEAALCVPRKGAALQSRACLRASGTLWRSHAEQRLCTPAELKAPLPQHWAWVSCSSPNLSEQPGAHLDELSWISSALELEVPPGGSSALVLIELLDWSPICVPPMPEHEAS